VNEFNMMEAHQPLARVVNLKDITNAHNTQNPNSKTRDTIPRPWNILYKEYALHITQSVGLAA
jgi:hypothetical protein